MSVKEWQKALQSNQLSLSIPGFTNKETSEAFGLMADYLYKADDISANDLKALVTKTLTTNYSGLEKSVLGGIQHVIAVDNGSYNAELWYKGGNWYAVTGAALQKATGVESGVHMIPGITKGMSITKAVPVFMETLFGDFQLKKGDEKPCNCSGK